MVTTTIADIINKETGIWIKIFNAITDFVYIQDPDFRFVMVNKALADFLGKDPKELIGKHCYKCIHKRDTPWPSCPCYKAMKFRKPFSEEVDDPNIGIPLLVTSSPIFDDDGELMGSVHIAKDITRQKLCEKELKTACDNLEMRVKERTADLSKANRELQNKIAEHKLLERRLRQSLGRIAALNKLCRQINTNLSIEQVSQAALEGIKTTIAPDFGVIFLRNDSQLTVESSYSSVVKFNLHDYPPHIVGECLCGLAILKGRPFYSRNIHTDPLCTRSECKLAGFQSFAALPVFQGEKVIGMLGVASIKERDFSEQSAFLETIVNGISIGLKNALLYEQIKKNEAGLESRIREKTAELGKYQQHLEKLVEERTAELAKTNQELQTEIAERQRVEKSLKISEEQFRTLFENAGCDGIIIVDPITRKFIVPNPRMCELTGYSKEELCQGGVPLIHPQKDMPFVFDQFQKLVTGEITIARNIPVLRKDRRVLYCDITASWSHLAGQDLIVGFFRDITEQKQAKEALQKAHEELEKRVEERTAELRSANKQLLHAEKLSALGRLAASISHEFKNPLYGIKMVLEELNGSNKLDEGEKKPVVLAIKECDRIFRLIGNLRDFYRPSEGEVVPVDIHLAIEETLMIMQKKLTAHKIKIVEKFTENIPPIYGVLDQIKQVLLNIISNADDAMAELGGQLTIQTKIQGDKIHIIVKDTGIGIPGENIDKIFDPFFTTRPEARGVGLGLSVSYGIIKRHRGNIWVESTPGKGSSFTIELLITSMA